MRRQKKKFAKQIFSVFSDFLFFCICLQHETLKIFKPKNHFGCESSIRCSRSCCVDAKCFLFSLLFLNSLTWQCAAHFKKNKRNKLLELEDSGNDNREKSVLTQRRTFDRNQTKKFFVLDRFPVKFGLKVLGCVDDNDDEEHISLPLSVLTSIA